MPISLDIESSGMSIGVDGAGSENKMMGLRNANGPYFI